MGTTSGDTGTDSELGNTMQTPLCLFVPSSIGIINSAPNEEPATSNAGT
jgi:hypothetical protein